MRIKFQSQVQCNFDKVSADFGEDLFRFLLPPSFVAGLKSYEGNEPGSRVHIHFHLPWPSDWISVITSRQMDKRKYVFVDEGERLPFGLKTWKHEHSVLKKGEGITIIMDNIHFTSQNRILDFLMYPLLFLAFYPRKFTYKKYFEK